jgi:transcription-repair coupling factor (superfamily II helicase)
MLSAVGFDLFASMLQEAVATARAGSTAGEAGGELAYPEVKIDLPVPFFFPEEYIPATDERVLFYRKLAFSSDLEAILGIEKQLEQKFGALPAAARNLVDRSLAKAMAGEKGIAGVSLQRNKLILEPVELSGEQASEMKSRGATYLVKSKRLLYPMQAGVGMLNALINLLKEL